MLKLLTTAQKETKLSEKVPEKEKWRFWHPIENRVIESGQILLFEPNPLVEFANTELEIQYPNYVLRPRIYLHQLTKRYSSYFYELLHNCIVKHAPFSRVMLERIIYNDFIDAPHLEPQPILHVLTYLLSGTIYMPVNEHERQACLRAAKYFGVPELLALYNSNNSTTEEVWTYDDWLLYTNEMVLKSSDFQTEPLCVFTINQSTQTNSLCLQKTQKRKEEKKQQMQPKQEWKWIRDYDVSATNVVTLSSSTCETTITKIEKIENLNNKTILLNGTLKDAILQTCLGYGLEKCENAQIFVTSSRFPFLFCSSATVQEVVNNITVFIGTDSNEQYESVIKQIAHKHHVEYICRYSDDVSRYAFVLRPSNVQVMFVKQSREKSDHDGARRILSNAHFFDIDAYAWLWSVNSQRLFWSNRAEQAICKRTQFVHAKMYSQPSNYMPLFTLSRHHFTLTLPQSVLVPLKDEEPSKMDRLAFNDPVSSGQWLKVDTWTPCRTVAKLSDFLRAYRIWQESQQQAPPLQQQQQQFSDTWTI